ncbi:unnamed protein product [Mytilus edulis]|uniref:Fibrinogen C-terminal domain-containing protein n=1 Tax=Mytilus edulis TaxID=6550 RepID=A0A8S3Q3F3_MYTED|nr:unnamed protein product [Mytilus edulis]
MFEGKVHVSTWIPFGNFLSFCYRVMHTTCMYSFDGFDKTSLFLDGNIECLYCSGVENATECQQFMTCENDEICYQQKYVNGAGSVLYDYGCSSQPTCRRIDTVPIIGRRDEGLHIKCTSCCSHGSLCNRNLMCDKTTNNGTVLLRECSEIKGDNLVNGVYNIYPDGTAAAVQVYCDMVTEKGAWTEIPCTIQYTIILEMV